MQIPYWLRNARHRARGLPQEFYRVANLKVGAELSAVVFRGCEFDAHGNIVAFRRREHLGVLSRRYVTTAGVTWLATAFLNTVEAETLNYHDCGTGITAESTGQTGLITPYGGARATGTQSNPGSTNVYRSVGTITFAGTFAITEHGLFTASSLGTLWDRSLFSAINVVAADSIQFTHDTTFPAGG